MSMFILNKVQQKDYLRVYGVDQWLLVFMSSFIFLLVLFLHNLPNMKLYSGVVLIIYLMIAGYQYYKYLKIKTNHSTQAEKRYQEIKEIQGVLKIMKKYDKTYLIDDYPEKYQAINDKVHAIQQEKADLTLMHLIQVTLLLMGIFLGFIIIVM